MIKIMLKNGATITINREIDPEKEQRDFMDLFKDPKKGEFIVWRTKEDGFVTVREKEISAIAFVDESPDNPEKDYMSEFIDILSDKILDRAEVNEEA